MRSALNLKSITAPVAAFILKHESAKRDNPEFAQVTKTSTKKKEQKKCTDMHF